MKMYGIFRPDSRGVYQISRRNRDNLAEGRPVRLRRAHVRNHPKESAWWNMRDLGPQGELAGEVVHGFPVIAFCPQCLTPNEIHHFSEMT